jgi:hypothetical protein
VAYKIKMLGTEPLLVVRGYADAEHGPWSRSLPTPGRTIRVHESTEPNVEYPAKFLSRLSSVRLGRPATYQEYKNEDLPNLRGSEVAAVISRLFDTCAGFSDLFTSKIPVEILDGHVYQDMSANDRKARIYALVFLKS